MVAHQFHEVGQFHHKFGIDNTTYDSKPGPRAVDPNLLEFRMKFLCEELQEAFESLGFTFPEYSIADLVRMGTTKQPEFAPEELDHAKMFDALIDLVYVAYGTAHILGYPWEEGWVMVQRANMAKVRAQPDGSDSVRGSSFDVVKPPGWIAPDIEGLLAEFGWQD